MAAGQGDGRALAHTTTFLFLYLSNEVKDVTEFSVLHDWPCFGCNEVAAVPGNGG